MPPHAASRSIVAAKSHDAFAIAGRTGPWERTDSRPSCCGATQVAGTPAGCPPSRPAIPRPADLKTPRRGPILGEHSTTGDDAWVFSWARCSRRLPAGGGSSGLGQRGRANRDRGRPYPAVVQPSMTRPQVCSRWIGMAAWSRATPDVRGCLARPISRLSMERGWTVCWRMSRRARAGAGSAQGGAHAGLSFRIGCRNVLIEAPQTVLSATRSATCTSRPRRMPTGSTSS